MRKNTRQTRQESDVTTVAKVGSLEVKRIDDGPACLLLPYGEPKKDGTFKCVWVSVAKAKLHLANVAAMKAFVANADKYPDKAPRNGNATKAAPAAQQDENAKLKAEIAALKARQNPAGNGKRFEVPAAPTPEPEREDGAPVITL